jgi:hypothetical protein
MLPVRISRGPTAEGRKRAGARPSSLAIALVLSGCASVSGKSDYDRGVSFASLRTFVWVDADKDSTGADAASSPFLQRRLRRSVERQLLDRGFVAGGGAEPVDFLVTAYAINASASYTAQQSGQLSGARISFGFGVGFGYPWWYGYGYRGCCRVGYPYYLFPYWGYPYWGYPYVGYPFGIWFPWVGLTWGAAPTYEIPEGHLPGTLVVDIWDARTGHLIWRGWSEGALLSAPETDELPEFIDMAVGKIMEKFPPER